MINVLSPAGDAASLRCDLCGHSGAGRYLRSPAGNLSCVDHPWCSECDTPHLRLPCPQDIARIRTVEHATEATEIVLRQLDDLGIRLPRVPLRVVPSLPAPLQGRCWKHRTQHNRRTIRGATIDVLAGLGPTNFGHVMSHEHTHALLHLHGSVPVDPALEEGVCEMVALVWLTNQNVSSDHLHRVWTNPDPVYGRQMRTVVRTARRIGVHVTLQNILAAGTLCETTHPAR